MARLPRHKQGTGSSGTDGALIFFYKQGVDEVFE